MKLVRHFKCGLSGDKCAVVNLYSDNIVRLLQKTYPDITKGNEVCIAYIDYVVYKCFTASIN